VYSEPGQGTSFKIYFPRVAAPEKLAPVVAAAAPASRGRETILVAEDSPELRALIVEMLESLGYRILHAGAPAAALALAREEPAAIKLLLTDVVMPGMNGRELARQLRAFRPDLRVLYMSGYTDEAVVRHGVLEAGMAFLQKPVSLEELGRKVREVLDAPPGTLVV
jgi:CheY-like chemotaxis protein